MPGALRLPATPADQESGVPGNLTLTTPDGREVTLWEDAGRGWRCCVVTDAPHYYLPLHPSLRAALTEALPGLAEDDPWLVATLGQLAPQELLG
jgi:hypothetical protein